MTQSVENRKQSNLPPILLVAAFALVAALYSRVIPRWQNSDEPFHYYYVKSLLYEKSLPEWETTYEAAHPPMYYLLAAVWAAPFAGMDAGFLDNWIRLLSVIMGSIAVWIYYRIGRDCLNSHALGMGMAAVAAINPSFVTICSVVSNDPGVVMACAAAIYIMLRATSGGGGVRAAAISGAAAGVACLFKITANFLPPLFVVFYFFHPANKGRSKKSLILEICVYTVALAAVCGWWFLLSYSRTGDQMLFNPILEKHPNHLHIPENFLWFSKSIMLNFWLPNDYLRGHPANLSFVVKLAYFSISVVFCAAAAWSVFSAITKKAVANRHEILTFLLCFILFMLQQYAINMNWQTAQARYMFTMYGPVAALVVSAFASAPERLYYRALFFVCAAGFIAHAMWLIFLLPGVEIPFNIS